VKSQAQPQLVALAEGANIPLDKPILLIGRHQECDIQIASRKISRRHCCIAVINDHLVIRDLGSTNGVRINGMKVVEGNLQANDEVMIGNMRYQLKWITESEETERAPANNGIKAGEPPLERRPVDVSLDVPMPLDEDEKEAPPARQAFPAMEIEDDEPIELAPIDPPSKG
jgi:pSer/pThr/pTyr-binding forkhead associated (FHA) protein